MPIVNTRTELNKDLSLAYNGAGLCRSKAGDPHSLPGQARISLDDGPLKEYLEEEILVPDLDRIAYLLWLAFTPDYAYISALHFQAARGRRIIVTENPYLHLVWYYDRIFIKPLPAYLLSSAFWQYLEKTDSDLWQAAAGLMRTYAILIRYEIDFRKAQSQELGLIPVSDGENPITYERFAQFIAPFAKLDDANVNPRYHYGEMRLTRLNWFARVFLRKLSYHRIHAQWNEYLGRFLAPFLTIFLLLAVALNAMQVELAVQSLASESSGWNRFAQISRWFAITTLFCVVGVSALSLALILFMFMHGQIFAQKVLRQKKSARHKSEKPLKTGVV